jgi:aspartyl-tRNA(Asn)/glutamyl-tRNA(Gln) amidotransferase subunit A
MDELHWLSARELLEAYRRQSLSPLEVAEHLLGRIEALDADVNAFCLVDPETTLSQARASQERWQNGDPIGLLDGVPVAIKDLVLSKGWPTLRGSKAVPRDQPWDQDAPSVARLREHGAVFIGKTTTPEFGWKGTNDAPLTGVTRNPWNLQKTPGGSSGGSAAALAAGFCPLAIGTDAGGSIRIPASFSGVFGLKPTFGLVAAWPASPFGTLAHLGPMSRTVEDAALFLNVISEPDARDWFQQPLPRLDYRQSLDRGIAGARIAFSPRLGWAQCVDPQVEDLVARAARRFADLGAVIEEVDPPGGDPSAIFLPLYLSSVGFLLGEWPEAKLALLDENLRALVEASRSVSRRDYQQAMAERAAYGAGFNQFMRDYDFLLTPSTAVPAFDTPLVTPFDPKGRLWLEWTPFSFPFNLTQQPAASICCGFTREELPVGLQIVGRMGDDAGVLRAARAYERLENFASRRPVGFA